MVNFSPDSKLWVYQAERELSETEEGVIHTYLSSFCRQWTAHNQQLLSGFEITHQRFIVLMVDETHTDASGCSIDKSVNALRALSEKLAIGFFDRMQVPYLEQDKISTVNFRQIGEALEQNKITASTLFFDLNVKTLGQFKKSFIIPLKEHWAFPKA